MSHGELNSLEKPSAAGGGLTLELVAPATDEATLNALLATGVDAVYFRVEALNGRRRRDGFSYDRVPVVVGAVRSRDARAYLSFDLDVAERGAPKLCGASRACAFGTMHGGSGARSGAAADPCADVYPELAFHFSEQTSITNTADVAAAAELGVARVVLARDLDVAELTTTSEQGDVLTEVVAGRGARYGVSGRCLLSSWITGRSEHRGFSLSFFGPAPDRER